MKKIKLFTLLMLLSASVMSQTTLTLGRMDTLCGTGQMPNATNMNNILYTLYNRPGSGNNNAPLFFVTAATTTSLAVNTYSSGTITAVSNGRLANVDGIKLMPGDSVLLKNEASQLKNGIYIISDTGTVSTKAVMYRNPRYNTTVEIYPSQVNVLSGTINGGAYFLETTINPIVGTNPIVYTSIPAPTGWLLTGNSGTTPGTNYIGTNDAQPLVIKTSGAEKVRVLTNGNIGIGTTTPTNDISFGNTSNRKIWIENTDSVTAGKSFTIQAGSTISGGSAGGFLSLSQTSRNYHGMCATPNGDVYACVYSGDIYKQTGGVGNFIALGQTSRQWYGMAAAPNGDVYACTLSGDIYKQTGGVGNFIALGQASRSWISMCAAPNGDVYACVNGGDIYKQTGGVGNFIALGETVRGWFGMTAAPNGDIYASVSVSGDIYKQTGGVGSFVALSQTLRNYQGMAAASNGDIYVCVNGGDIYKQTGGVGNFNALGQASRSWFGMAGAPNGDVYANTTSAAQIYKQANGGNVPGGNLVLSSGQSKGTSPSDIIFTTPITNTVSSSSLNPFSTKLTIRGNSINGTCDTINFTGLNFRATKQTKLVSKAFSFYNDSSLYGNGTNYDPIAYITSSKFEHIRWDAKNVALNSSASFGSVSINCDSGSVPIHAYGDITLLSDTGKIVLSTPLSTDSINLSRNPPINDNSKQIATTAWTNSVIAAIPIGWSLTGNSGTVDGTNFIGTTDNTPFNFRVNNVRAGKITSAGLLSLGYQSLLANTSGTNNTAIGSRALVNNTTGQENTCVGNQCGEDITTGIRNTLIGHQAAQGGGTFTGNRNTGVGLVVLGGNALSAVTVTGNDNVAMGYQTLGRILSGSFNTSLGSVGLFANTTGSGNTTVGYNTMSSNTAGSYNTALGFNAFRSATGNFGIAIGDSAGLTEIGNEMFHLGVHNSPYLDGSMTVGAKTLTLSGAFAATTSITTPSITVTNATASTFAGFDASKNLISGNITYVGAGTTTVTTTGTAPTQTVTITGAATQTITLIGDATGSGTNTITVTNTYPTAWSSTTTITIGAVTTAPTKATTVQNDFVRYRTMSPVIGSTPKTVRADYMYSATSATGAAAGSGNYLFTLPDGFSFNSTEYTFYTGTSILSNINLSIYAINRGGPVGMLNGAGFYDWAIVVPYDATRFRLMPMGGTAPNAWVGSGWYQMDQTNKAFSLTFDFFAQ